MRSSAARSSLRGWLGLWSGLGDGGAVGKVLLSAIKSLKWDSSFQPSRCMASMTCHALLA